MSSATDGLRDEASGAPNSARRSPEELFAILVREHEPGLRAFVLSCFASASDADDLVQETFVEAWLHLNRYDQSRPFSAWLRGIAGNRMGSWRRTARRERNGQAAVSAARAAERTAVDPEWTVAAGISERTAAAPAISAQTAGGRGISDRTAADPGISERTAADPDCSPALLGRDSGAAVGAGQQSEARVPAREDSEMGARAGQDCGTGVPGRQDGGTGVPPRPDCEMGVAARQDGGTGVPGRQDCGTGVPARQSEATFDFVNLDPADLSADTLAAIERLFERFNRPARGDVYRDCFAALADCLEALPPADRQAVRLFYADHRPCPAIAAVLGKTVEAIKKRLQRARAELKECIEHKLAAGA